MGGDALPFVVHELKGEVAEHPQERGEVVGQGLNLGFLLFVIFISTRGGRGLDLDGLCDINDEREVFQGLIVNNPSVQTIHTF